MFHLLALVLAATVPIHGRSFNTPILEGADFSDPGVIQLANTYYLVTSTNSSQPEKYPIYDSTDLRSWRLVGYVFNEFNIPRWADAVQPFLAPRLYQIGNNYHVYFTATDLNTGMVSIGVAVAPHPAGPYLTNGRSLYSESTAHVYDPAIIIDDKDIYLLWVADNNIKCRMLYTNGMSFYATYSTELISSTSNSDASIHGPFYTKLQGDHYLLYTQSDSTGESLQVASSSYALGPYEHQNTTFSDPSNYFEGIRHASLIGENDRYGILVYDVYRKNEVGHELPKVIRMTSVEWQNILPKFQYNYGK